MIETQDIRARLEESLSCSDHFVEMRFHRKRSRSISMRRGELADMSSRVYEGLGVRVLAGGCWGFASTSELDEESIRRAIADAESMALALAPRKKETIRLAPGHLARGHFLVPGYDELEAIPLADKLQLVTSSEKKTRGASSQIGSASTAYSEIFEDKVIVTSDGASALIQLARPELRVLAVAGSGSEMKRGHDSIGATGDWTCLFRNRDVDRCIETAAENAVSLLKAPPAAGGRAKVILSPAMVGLLSHEAIGHTVEADFVSSGSIAQGKLGRMVASSLVTLCDSGQSEYVEGAGGIVPVDDEGIMAGRTVIIEKGKLVSYLHNRESAAAFGVEATGNGRAWEYSAEPLIRMRNTYIEPGEDELSSMISNVEEGFLIDGPEGGQADATGEFMFGASRVRKITNGKLADFVQKVTVSGNAFDVLSSVDAVSKDFRWDLGAGYCGKGQPAKVDAGGPYISCELLVGGASPA